MRGFALAVAVIIASAAVHAEPMLPEVVCASAAAAAELKFGLPAGLLLAIGKIESGRASSLGRMPWPWSINAEGADLISNSAEGSIAQVRALQARGVRSIDAGCFQINLQYHPQAFTSLEQAFDPVANARYAAEFLTSLHQRSGDWGAAVASYHSATPWRGEGYRQLVWQAWTGALLQPRATTSLAFSVAPMRVFVPGTIAATTVPRSIAALRTSGEGRVPQVFRPQGVR